MKKNNISRLLFTGLFALGLVGGLASASQKEVKEVKADNEVIKTRAETKKVTVSDLNGLKNALKSADANTEITITARMQVVETTADLNGNGCVIKVQNPYVNEDFSINAEASAHQMFYIEDSSSFKLKNATLIGGRSSIISANYSTCYFENVTFTRGWQGVNSTRTHLLFKNCNFTRLINNNWYGAALKTYDNYCKVTIDGCTFTDNINVSADGVPACGAIYTERTYMFINNSLFYHNYSTSPDASTITMKSALVFLMNSTIVGNVNKTSSNNRKGAINLDFSDGFGAYNSIITDNYNNDGTVRGDISYNDSMGGSPLLVMNSIYGQVNNDTGSKFTYTNSIQNVASNYELQSQTVGVRTGATTFTTAVTHPVAANVSVSNIAKCVPLADEGAQLTGGIKTYLDYSDIKKVKVGYYNGSSIVAMPGSDQGAPAANKEVTTYLGGAKRSEGVIGATGPSTGSIYTLSGDGSVENGSISGLPPYEVSLVEGTEITLKGYAEEGYGLEEFTLTSGSIVTHVPHNPYTLVVDRNYTVTAKFSAGYTVSYNANGGSGSVPETLAFANTIEADIMAKPDSLKRVGYDFISWNTAADGSGDDYAGGGAHNFGENVTLYAQWKMDEGVAEVINKINLIGDVILTPECKGKIDAARAAYDALDASLRSAVSNYSTLTAAEAKYASLVKVNEVQTLINNLGDVEYSDDYASQLNTINSKYNALNATEKAQITGYDGFKEKQNSYNEIKATVAKIEAIGEVTVESGEVIKEARDSFDALTEDQQATIPTYEEKLVQAEETYRILTTKKSSPAGAIVGGIIGGLVGLLILAYVLLMFVFNKWIKKDDKAVRVLPFSIGKKEDKLRVLAFLCKFEYRADTEIYKSKEEALK